MQFPERGSRRGLHALLGVVALAMVVAAVPAAASNGSSSDDLWRAAGKPAKVKDGKQAQVRAETFRAVSVDRGRLAQLLRSAPSENAAGAALVVSLPAPDGSLQRFALQESLVMEAGLAAKHPELKTYSGRGIDDPTATIRADLTPLGFHASVRSAQGGWYVDPYYNGDQSVYASYYLRDLEEPAEEHVKHEPLAARDGDGAGELESFAASAVPDGPKVTLRTYRIAIISDPSYANYFGAANVTAAKVTLMNRVNHIYETESGIRMILIADTDKTNLNTTDMSVGANGPCGTAPCYTAAQMAGCGSSTLGRNRIVLGQIIGASHYDVGHNVFGLSGGGIASLNSVGGNTKAQGCTGLPQPVGDFFAVDYVAHEIGHQLGSNHTFNGNQHNCSGGNRSAANSVEPGSGSSIMAYAGICRHDDLQPHTDPYWSWRSFDVIDAYVSNPRAPINEVQNASLRDWNTDGQSFRIRYNGVDSDPIVRGTNYTAAAISAAITALTGGTATVQNFAGGGSPSDNGFQVTWTGANAATNLDSLELVDFTGGASGFVGETAKGGPIDNMGWLIEESSNNAPTVTTAMSYVIPIRTPFALTGEAHDANGDELTYMWEQTDRGAAAGTALANNTKTNGPLFRVFGKAHTVTPEGTLESPSPGLNLVDGNPTRIFPDLEQILANNTNAVSGGCEPFAGVWPVTLSPSQLDCYSEFLPTADYVGFAGVNASPASLNFRLTVRDSRHDGGGIGSSATQLVLAHGAGPFLVTSQATSAPLNGGNPQLVTWDVANTDLAPVNAAEVKISLSLDGGWTYPIVLAGATANDGSQTVTLPNLDTSEARIRIEAVGNVFFDVSETDFTIRSAQTQAAVLIQLSTGVGTGKALESIARQIHAKIAAGIDACDQLQSYLDAVAAQRGKSISQAKADELTAAAIAIRTALGC